LDGDDEDVILSVAIRGERDPFAVGAEDGIEVMLLVHGQMRGNAALGIDEPDVAQVAEGDGLAVRRNVRRAHEADRLLSVDGGSDEEYGYDEDACHGR